jgi:drug/metabolite transporter (DMT)-like permease
MSSSSASSNSRGILFMVAASTGFIINDTCVKLASEEISIAQIIILRSLIALPLFLLVGWHQGAFRHARVFGERFIWLRTLGELGSTALYLTALAHMDIANSTSIMQVVPLATTAAAAYFFGEKVGLRRWTAVLIGLAAVMLIVRPGLEGFSAWSLLALAGVGFVVLRDVSSRMMPPASHPIAVSALSLVMLVVLGAAMLSLESWEPVSWRAFLLCAGSGATLSISFVLIVQAMRHGELAVVSPFRYVLLLWAIIIQVMIFGVVPDALTLAGAAILVATGLYTLYREGKRGTRSAALSAVAVGAPSRG